MYKKDLYIMLSIYILVPLLILFLPILYKCKFLILTVVGVGFYIFMKVKGVSNKQLGLSRKNALKSLKRNIPLIVLFLALIIIYNLVFQKKYIPNESFLFYGFYILVSSPIQEFLYRGIFGCLDEYIIKNNKIVMIISSLCYSFVHIIYKDIITCILTFFIGLIWYYLYKKDNNLLGVSVSHSILGVLTIFLGIID